jgi:glutamate decarboxylase
MSNLTRTADYLSDSLEALGYIIMSKKSGEGLPLVAFRLPPKEDRHYDEFALAHTLVCQTRSRTSPRVTLVRHGMN